MKQKHDSTRDLEGLFLAFLIGLASKMSKNGHSKQIPAIVPSDMVPTFPKLKSNAGQQIKHKSKRRYVMSKEHKKAIILAQKRRWEKFKRKA